MTSRVAPHLQNTLLGLALGWGSVVAALGALALSGCLGLRGLQGLPPGLGPHLSVFAFQALHQLPLSGLEVALFGGLALDLLRRVLPPPLVVLTGALGALLLGLAHLARHLLLGPVLGVPLAGVQLIGWLDTDLSGPASLTGGACGPEGGLVAASLGAGLAGLLLRSRLAAARG